MLRYRVNVSLGGNIGHGEMRVEGPVTERGVVTWRLVSEMKAKRGFMKATDRTTSWLDPVRFASTRFEKQERHPLSRSDEAIEIDAEAGTYRELSGDRKAPESGDLRPLGAPNPLDELSFLYFLRTLPLDREGAHNFSRHFDESRALQGNRPDQAQHRYVGVPSAGAHREQDADRGHHDADADRSRQRGRTGHTRERVPAVTM